IIRADRHHTPHRRAALRVDGNQAPVLGARIHLAVPEGDAAYPPGAPQPGTRRLRRLRVVTPQQLAGSGIDRVDHAESDAEIDHAIHFKRCRGDIAGTLELEAPEQAKALDAAGVDLS